MGHTNYVVTVIYGKMGNFKLDLTLIMFLRKSNLIAHSRCMIHIRKKY